MLKQLWESVSGYHSGGAAETLKDNILFQDLSSKELKFVTNIVHSRSYQPGEFVFKQGDTGFGMYIIARGMVEISVEKTNASYDTGNTVITRLKEGDFFGELALVEENGKRSAAARAVEPTELIGFFKPNLFELIERRPATGVKIAMRLSEVLGLRLIETNKVVSSLNEEVTLLRQGDSE